MYVPATFRAEEPLTVVHEEPFATVVSLRTSDVAHVPLLVRSTAPLTLIGHVAAASPLAEEIRGGTELLAIFTGVHGYVSPRDYATAPHVPTWNYVATHVRGRAEPLTGEAALEVLDRMAARFEPDGGWSRAETPPGFAERLLPALVAFELRAASIEGKAKLSQNRARADREAAIAAMERRQPALAAAMRRALEG